MNAKFCFYFELKALCLYQFIIIDDDGRHRKKYNFYINYSTQKMEDNVFLNDIKMILIHSIIEDSIDKLTIINHLRYCFEKDIEILSPSSNNVISPNNIKKLEMNVINKILNKLGENNGDQNKLNIESISNLTNDSNKKINELNKKIILEIKNNLQKSLELSLNEVEKNGDCQKLNEIIKNEQITLQRRNEMFLMLKQLKNKMESLQITTKNEEKEFNLDCLNNKKQIISLKEEIKSLKKEIDVDQKLKKYQLIAKLNTNQRKYKINQDILNVKLSQIQKELNRENKTFKATKIFLKDKLKILENDCLKWTEKYHVETTKHKEKLNEIRKKREKTLSDLKKSEIKYDKEKTIYLERIQTEKRKKELEQKVYSSAILIQKVTRGYLCRLRLKREKEASKKKSKKGKKGGKKKGKKKK